MKILDEVGEDLMEVAEEEFINETDDVVEVEEDGWLDSPRQVKDGEEHVVVVVEGGDLDSPRQLKDDVVVDEGDLDSPRQLKDVEGVEVRGAQDTPWQVK